MPSRRPSPFAVSVHPIVMYGAYTVVHADPTSSHPSLCAAQRKARKLAALPAPWATPTRITCVWENGTLTNAYIGATRRALTPRGSATLQGSATTIVYAIGTDTITFDTAPAARKILEAFAVPAGPDALIDRAKRAAALARSVDANTHVIEPSPGAITTRDDKPHHVWLGNLDTWPHPDLVHRALAVLTPAPGTPEALAYATLTHLARVYEKIATGPLHDVLDFRAVLAQRPVQS